MPKTISIVGEPILPYVRDQISKRQQIYGSGINRSREPHEISYLNSRNAWIKLGSSVSVDSPEPDVVEDLNSPGHFGERRLKRIFQEHRGGISQPYDDYKGVNLAKNFVLFNGTSILQEDGTYSTRSGITNNTSFANDSAYGLGGTEFGIQPMPGITSFNVNHKSNGALRDGNITLTAYNRFQFDVIETLYLRLGYSMLIEWGNNIYYDTNEENPSSYSKMGSTLVDSWWFRNNGKSFLEVLDQIEITRKKYSGNYDGFMAKVVNFKWSYETDGTYNISIDFVSLGSIIESLKVDVLHPQYQVKGELLSEEYNQNSIKNYLKALEIQDQTFSNIFEIEEINAFERLGYANIVNIHGDDNTERYLDIQKQYPYFIRLGRFLEFMRDYICVHNQNSSACFPAIDFHLTSESLCNIRQDLISIDPRKCIVKPNPSYLKSKGIKEPDWTFPLADFFIEKTSSDPTEYFGRINDIYINFELIRNSIGKSERQINLYSFLQSICQGINSCFGNYIDLYVDIDENKNLLVIRDRNLRPSIKVDTAGLKNRKLQLSEYGEDEYPILNFYGYNRGTSESNFITSFSFETFLSNNFTNAISISAASANQSVTEDDTAFSKWSKGLTDRFQLTTTDGNPNGCDVNASKPQPKEDRTPEEQFNIEYDAETLVIDLGSAATTAGSPLTSGLGPIYTWWRSITKSWSRRNYIREQARKERYLDWDNYLKDALLSSTQNYRIYSGTSQQSTSNVVDAHYFRFDDQFITRGKQIISTKNIEDAKADEEKNNNASGGIGYIPAEISITLDGISGVRIYNGLKLDGSFLPFNYDTALDLIITAVDHSISDNDWQTTIKALAYPKRTAPIAPADTDALVSQNLQTDSNGVIIEEDPNAVNSEFIGIGDEGPRLATVYPPLGNADILSTLRNDSGGSGGFGASRSGRAHRGIDLSTTLTNREINLTERFPHVAGLRSGNVISRIGNRIYSPIQGQLTLSRATTHNILPGVKIVGEGEHAGLVAYIFYMAPFEPVLNEVVNAGDSIGLALDLSLDYPENVGDHIHFAIRRGQRYLNPGNPSEVTYKTGGFTNNLTSFLRRS